MKCWHCKTLLIDFNSVWRTALDAHDRLCIVISLIVKSNNVLRCQSFSFMRNLTKWWTFANKSLSLEYFDVTFRITGENITASFQYIITLGNIAAALCHGKNIKPSFIFADDYITLVSRNEWSYQACFSPYHFIGE